MTIVALPYLTLLSMAATAYACKHRENRCSIGLMIPALVLNIGFVADKAIIDVALLLIFVVWVLYSIICRRFIFREHIWFLVVVGIGSQVMLLISAIWGYRCMMSLYVVYMLIIACLLYHADTKQQQFVLLAGTLTAIHPIATMVFCVATTIKQLLSKRISLKKYITPALCCTTVLIMFGLLVGYAKNSLTHCENLQYTYTQKNSTVFIKELPNDIYSWYFVPFSEFHENYYRILHGISEETDILYVQLPE